MVSVKVSTRKTFTRGSRCHRSAPTWKVLLSPRRIPRANGFFYLFAYNIIKRKDESIGLKLKQLLSGKVETNV